MSDKATQSLRNVAHGSVGLEEFGQQSLNPVSNVDETPSI